MRILDLSAGKRAIWFDKACKDAVYVDVRPSVKPTIIADTRYLPFAEGVFDMVVFDPPHVNFGENADMSKTYGWHTTDAIRELIRETAAQAWLVTKPDALMAFKWNDHDQKLEKVLDLMGCFWEPLFGHKTAMRTKHASITTWVMLRRI